jgi:hypothetical protein
MAAEPRTSESAFQELLTRSALTKDAFEFTYANGVVSAHNKNTLAVTLYMSMTRRRWLVFLSSTGFLRLHPGSGSLGFIVGPHVSRFKDADTLASWLVRIVADFSSQPVIAGNIAAVVACATTLGTSAVALAAASSTQRIVVELTKNTRKGSMWAHQSVPLTLPAGITPAELDATLRAVMETC